MATLKEFDFIIVGAGAAGSVLANRLSADPSRRVLVLEAGGLDTSPAIADPGGFVQLWNSDLDWQFGTEAQPGLGGRKLTISQGKVLGGSTSLNAMMYVRGNRRNFDLWSALGADGWSYDEVLPYFKRSEDYEGGASTYHGSGGPLSVRDCPDEVMRSEAFMHGAVELGYDGPSWDYNGARQENGAGLLQFHIRKDGKRASAANAFLAPVSARPNLTIRTNAEVTRLLIDGGRAVGIEYIAEGQVQQVRAEGEVILSAGAFQSPKILMLSGLGPADQLRAHGIAPVADLPGVGKNLQDHVQLLVAFRSRRELPNTTLLTGNVLFLRSRPGMDAAPPDLQLNFTPSVPRPLAPVLDFGGPAFIFLPILVQPYSRGEVRLRSAHPQDAPLIDPNYLACDADLEVLLRAIALCRELAATRAFGGINGGELSPGPDADLAGYVRAMASTLWHPAGTCKIGHDAMAVVDPQLRVRGVKGLRVADASVMPTVPSGNTVAACFMIGEKAAHMLIEGH